MNKFFNKEASKMSIGDTLIFSTIISVVSLVLVIPMMLVIGFVEGTVELPKPKIPEKLKNLRRRYINVDTDNSREDKED